jgi:hypothetical protein
MLHMIIPSVIKSSAISRHVLALDSGYLQAHKAETGDLNHVSALHRRPSGQILLACYVY